MLTDMFQRIYFESFQTYWLAIMHCTERKNRDTYLRFFISWSFQTLFEYF